MLYRYRKVLPMAKRLVKLSKSILSTSPKRNYKVAVLGASGGIGQPLSLLLKQNPLISRLALYDIAKVTPGVAKDISHINTDTLCDGFAGPESLEKVISGAEIVVIPAGMPRKPGMSRDDLFNTNATIVSDLISAVAKYSPCALIAIITNPVNSMVPIASEIMLKSGVYNACKIFGVTTLDLVRAATFVSARNRSKPACQYVPVVGGHAGTTIVPLLSLCDPPLCLESDKARDDLVHRIQEAGTEVVQAKAGGGSATLSMAFAAARFTEALLKGLTGEKDIVECAYVRSNVTDALYFSTPLVLGENGIQQNLGYGPISAYEKELIAKAVPIIQKNIKTGIDFVAKKSGDPTAACK